MDIFATKDVISTFSNPLNIAYILAMASLFGWMIAWTYHKTKSATENKFELENTLIIMTVITALIIMIVGDSVARAIGIFGAFSMIRFRTPMKNPRDTAFVFFALVAGTGAGTALSVGTVSTATLLFGFSGVLFICLLILFLDYSHVFGMRERDYIVTFCVGTQRYSDQKFKEVIDRYVEKEIDLNITPEPNRAGKCANFTFSITMKQRRILNNFIKELSNFDGVSNINIIKPLA